MDSQYCVVLCICCNLKRLLVTGTNTDRWILVLFIEMIACSLWWSYTIFKFYSWPQMNQMSSIVHWKFNTVGTCYYVITWNVKTYVSYPLECKMSQEWLKWCSETTATTTTTTTTTLNSISFWGGGQYVIAWHTPTPPQNLTWGFE